MSRHKIIMLGIILLGAVLRLFILSQRGSFWFDEVFSTHFAAMDLRTMWSFLKFENNPPLYFVLLHFWIKLFGNSELAVRALSMLFGIASIPMIYILGVRLYQFPPLRIRGGEEGLRTDHNPPQPSLILREGGGRIVGLFAAFLLAISTFQVFYATETRMYAMYLFLTLATVLLFLRLEDNKHRFIVSCFLFLAVLFLVWTHITAWLIIAALGAYLLWARVHHKRADRPFWGGWGFLVIVALAGLSLLPWLWTFLKLKIASPLSQGWFFYIPPPRNFFLDMLEGFLVFGENNAFVVTLLSVVIVVLLIFAVRPLTSAVKFLLCWLFIPLLIGFAFQNAVPRYFIAAAPALYLLLGVGFANLAVILRTKSEESLTAHMRLPAGLSADKAGKAGVRSFATLRMTRWVIPLLIGVLVMPDYVSLSKIGNHQWDKVAGWIEMQETRNKEQETNSLILINPHSEVLALERYYKGALPVVGFYPREDNWDRDMRIVRTNWVSLVDKNNIPRLRDITAGYDRVFLITGETDPDAPRNLIPAWFWEQGWRRIADKDFGKKSVLFLEH